MARYNTKKHKGLINYLLERQNYICPYCGDKIDNIWDVDHIIPKRKGGTNNYDNLCICHKECNNIKGTKSIEEVITIFKPYKEFNIVDKQKLLLYYNENKGK